MYAATVFDISIATVIGPTPPGTGVILEHLGATFSKSTSPTSLYPLFVFSDGILFNHIGGDGHWLAYCRYYNVGLCAYLLQIFAL